MQKVKGARTKRINPKLYHLIDELAERIESHIRITNTHEHYWKAEFQRVQGEKSSLIWGCLAGISTSLVLFLILFCFILNNTCKEMNEFDRIQKSQKIEKGE